MACTAGETFCVIDYNGDVRACELRGKLTNLKDYDFDFSRFWADTIRQRDNQADRLRPMLVYPCLQYS